MTEQANKDRSERAYRTLLVYAQYVNQDEEEMETNMTDLVADLAHLADEYGIEWQRVIEWAQRHHDAELEEASA